MTKYIVCIALGPCGQAARWLLISLVCTVFSSLLTMAEGGRRRVNTVCLYLVTGLFNSHNTHLLLTAILRDMYGIANEDLY